MRTNIALPCHRNPLPERDAGKKYPPSTHTTTLHTSSPPGRSLTRAPLRMPPRSEAIAQPAPQRARRGYHGEGLLPLAWQFRRRTLIGSWKRYIQTFIVREFNHTSWRLTTSRAARFTYAFEIKPNKKSNRWRWSIDKLWFVTNYLEPSCLLRITPINAIQLLKLEGITRGGCPVYHKFK